MSSNNKKKDLDWYKKRCKLQDRLIETLKVEVFNLREDVKEALMLVDVTSSVVPLRALDHSLSFRAPRVYDDHL